MCISLWWEPDILQLFYFQFFSSKNFNSLFFVLNDFILPVLLILIICFNILVNVLPNLIIKSSWHFHSLDDSLLKFLLFSNKWECRTFISLSCFSLLLRNCPIAPANFRITLCITLLIKENSGERCCC